jgi:4-hydroxy-tetrahydrodipicolinate reductase
MMNAMKQNQAAIAVGVVGARGRMGSLVCEAVRGATDMELVAEVDTGQALSSLATADVVVDFTVPDAVMDTIAWCVENARPVAVGTSGFDETRLAQVREMLRPDSHVMIVPNFAVGAVLMMHWAAQAAKFFPDAEVLEYHHSAKVDAPSGTAIRTAQLMAQARREAGIDVAEVSQSRPAALGDTVDGIPVHASRGSGFIAHQDVVFGGPGERLTIRHDSLDRASFMPGVLLAVREISTRPGLTIGLEPLLGL